MGHSIRFHHVVTFVYVLVLWVQVNTHKSHYLWAVEMKLLVILIVLVVNQIRKWWFWFENRRSQEHTFITFLNAVTKHLTSINLSEKGCIFGSAGWRDTDHHSRDGLVGIGWGGCSHCTDSKEAEIAWEISLICSKLKVHPLWATSLSETLV